MVAVADFKISGTLQATLGYDADHDEVLELQLESTSVTNGTRVVFSVVTTSKDAPAPVLDPPSGIPATPTGIVTCTMPAAGAHTWELQCQVDEGRNALGRIDSAYTKKRAIAIRTPNLGLRKWLPAETVQYAARSWSDEQNALVDALDELGLIIDALGAPFILDTDTPVDLVPNGILGRALTATLEFVRSAGLPLSVRRVDEAVDHSIDVLRLVVDATTAGVAGYGATLLARVKGASAVQDAGSIDFQLTNVGAGTEASAVAMRLRKAGGALAAALKVAPGVTSFFDDGVLTALFTHPDTTAPSLVLQKRSGTGAAAPQTFTVRARQGRDVAGGTNNTGDHFALRSGLVGTGGADGSAGSLILGTGDDDRISLDGSSSTITMSANVVAMNGIRAVSVDELSYDASVALGFFKEHSEITITGDITFTDGPGLSGVEFWVHVYRDAVVAPVITWPVAFLFATGQGAISATNNRWTHWHFYVDMGGTVHCLQRTTSE